ncbi:hypothetical protein Y032_0081g1510 [Ancylostoma ceylanicum]|uniref:Uncharacterized protein n=1 Tax=Ancylostoma ceylanicum TaxID=53326 RepID=A0A016TSQ2_9BILA|nr:hypothetical protein Y032_0081g1510 [Ancylostoma ceylanicum]
MSNYFQSLSPPLLAVNTPWLSLHHSEHKTNGLVLHYRCLMHIEHIGKFRSGLTESNNVQRNVICYFNTSRSSVRESSTSGPSEYVSLRLSSMIVFTMCHVNPLKISLVQ